MDFSYVISLNILVNKIIRKTLWQLLAYVRRYCVVLPSRKETEKKISQTTQDDETLGKGSIRCDVQETRTVHCLTESRSRLLITHLRRNTREHGSRSLDLIHRLKRPTGDRMHVRTSLVCFPEATSFCWRCVPSLMARVTASGSPGHSQIRAPVTHLDASVIFSKLTPGYFWGFFILWQKL